MLETLIKLISIPSVRGESVPNAPFGRETADALDFMLNCGKSYGMKTVNMDGFCGYVEFGEGKEILGILCHLDVVPPGDGWSLPPFQAEVRDGRVYGRGAIDDKGPAVCALFAMKSLVEQGFKPKRRVRLILGLDEESGWGCVEHYKKTEEIPTLSFVPDSDFPVINAEKGIAHYNFCMENNIGGIIIKGGEAVNMVPDKCTAILPLQFEGLAENAQVLSRAPYKIMYTGKAAHASAPESGENAISKMMRGLYGAKVKNPMVNLYCKCLDGISLGEGCTFSANMVDMDQSGGVLAADVRYMTDKKESDLFFTLSALAKRFGVTVKRVSHHPPLYVPEDSGLVTSLLGVYEKHTGQKAAPLLTGGGTYARAFSNAAAFGPQFPGRPGLAHQPDEYMEIEDMHKCVEIYADAIRTCSA